MPTTQHSLETNFTWSSLNNLVNSNNKLSTILNRTLLFYKIESETHHVPFDTLYISTPIRKAIYFLWFAFNVLKLTNRHLKTHFEKAKENELCEKVKQRC